MVMDTGLNDAEPVSEEPDPGPGNGNADPKRPNASRLPNAHKLAQDWVTLWQSELSAMAADPEIRESWQTVMTLWSGTLSTVMHGFTREPNASWHDGTRHPPRPPDASRPSTAAAAPDARDAEIERLARHVDALERRLAELERSGDAPIHSADPPRHGPNGKHRSGGRQR